MKVVIKRNFKVFIGLCDSVKRAIEHDYRGGMLLVLNVGSGENNLQIFEIARTIQRVVTACELKFLSENPDLDKEGLIRDRKVNQVEGIRALTKSPLRKK